MAPTPTFSGDVIMQDCSDIDICVRGSGEEICYELIENLINSQGINQVPGITYRRDGEIITNPSCLSEEVLSKQTELDDFPSPYFSGVLDIGDLIRYNQGTIPFLTSRGCIYHCTYCNFSAMSNYKVRFHSIERVIEELKLMDAYRRQHQDFVVEVCDDCFSLDLNRLKQICRRIIEEKIALRLAATELRADIIDYEALELLARAGFEDVNFGLESSSPEVLYNVKKVRFKDEDDSSFSAEKKICRKS